MTRTPDPIPTPAPLAGEPRILVVDDEEHIRRLLSRFLSRSGYQVDTAGSVTEAVGRLVEAEYDLVITDLKMPGPSGLELLVEVRSRRPDTRLIMMSAHADVPSAAAAIDRGIDHLVLKPFELDEIDRRVRQSLAERQAQHEARRERELLEARLKRRDTESRIHVLRAAHALTAAVEAKDTYTAGHARRATAYGISLAEEVGEVDLLRFRLGGELHDVGKIGVPDAILNKPANLNPQETSAVREHPVIGEKILAPLVNDPVVLRMVRHHHERSDGSGYPDRLRGDDISPEARILAVTDTLDAMTSARAYRDALTWEEAVSEIRRCAGSQFDPRVVEAFERALPELTDLYTHFVRTDTSGVLRARGSG